MKSITPALFLHNLSQGVSAQPLLRDALYLRWWLCSKLTCSDGRKFSPQIQGSVSKVIGETPQKFPSLKVIFAMHCSCTCSWVMQVIRTIGLLILWQWQYTKIGYWKFWQKGHASILGLTFNNGIWAIMQVQRPLNSHL